MMDTSWVAERVRELLSLAPGDRVRVVGAAELADASVGLAASADAPEPLLMLVESRPFFRPQPLLPPPEVPSDIDLRTAATKRPLDLAEVPLGVVTWESSASIVVCEPSGAASLSVVGGAAFPWHAGAFVAHLGAGPVLLEIAGAGRELYFVGEPPQGVLRRGATIAVVEVERVTPRAARLEVDMLLDGLGVEPWLRDAAARLEQRATSVHRAAAMGLLARLWVARAPADRAHVRKEGGGVSRRVRARAKALDPADLARIERAALEWCERLGSYLEELARFAVEAPEEVPRRAATFVEGRDDLASVAWTLGAADAARAKAIEAALAALDREVAAHSSIFAFAPDLGDDDRVLAVQWQEPHQWWGALARA